nr:MAG TPA: hypothetical protein [Caudoviricetes sp.]
MTGKEGEWRLKDFAYEEEQLIELYLETKNFKVLQRLLEISGYMVLLKLDIAGLNMFRDMIITNKYYDIYYAIDTVGTLRMLHDNLIETFFNCNDEEVRDSILDFIEHIEWDRNTRSKNILTERFVLPIKLYNTIKNDDKESLFLKQLLESIVKNQATSFQRCLDIITEIPESAEVVIENLPLKVSGLVNVFTLMNALENIRATLDEVSKDKSIDVTSVMEHGIDKLLEYSTLDPYYFDIFVSVLDINRYIIKYNKESFLTFFRRFTVMLWETYKEQVTGYIENAKEDYYEFPLDVVLDDMNDRTLRGLAFILFFGNDLRSYNVISNDVVKSDLIDKVQAAFTTYYVMEILPEDWTTSDDYYKQIKKADTISESVTTEFDIDSIIGELD